MKIFALAKRAKQPRQIELFSRKITAERESADLHHIRQSRSKLLWCRAGSVVKVRIKPEPQYSESERLELVLNRNEILLLASRYLEHLGDEKFLTVVKKQLG